MIPVGDSRLIRGPRDILLSCRLSLVLTLSVAWCTPAGAAEIDSLTLRHLPLEDARVALEFHFNRALREGVEVANSGGSDCDADRLYDSIHKALASPFIGHVIASELDLDPDLDRHRVSREDSIYQDLGWLDNPSVHLKDLVAVVRVNDTRLGVDKFGHFFVEGWKYFDKAYLKGKGLNDVVDWGDFTERTYFGNYTTGVYSYADLVANFEGMRFWLRLLGQQADPLLSYRYANRPYVNCRRRFLLFGERRWYLVRRFKLLDYVSPVWDEAVNCSSYRSPEIAALVRRRISSLEQQHGVDYHCPVNAAACAQAQLRYGELARHLLHPSCLAALPKD